jgi:hypothetical protein
MELKNFAIGIIIFGMVVAALGTIAGEMSVNYDANIDTAFTNNYNTMSQMNTYATNLQNSIATKSITPGSLVGVLLNGIGAFFQLLFQMITFPVTLMSHVWIDLGLPAATAWVATAICTMIALSVIFAIVSAALKSKV